MTDVSLTPRLMQAAAALLGWSASDLARHAGIAQADIERFGRGSADDRLPSAGEEALRHALETAGVAFVEEDGGGAGVRWKDAANAAASVPVEELTTANDK